MKYTTNISKMLGNSQPTWPLCGRLAANLLRSCLMFSTSAMADLGKVGFFLQLFSCGKSIEKKIEELIYPKVYHVHAPKQQLGV